jgi:circadian clock protein KaiC
MPDPTLPPLMPLIGTGIEGLDQILEGGLTPERLYLVEGNPGSGKTTLGLQFLLEGARCGEQGLYVMLSETRTELVAVARSHGWTLDGITLYEMVPEDALTEPPSTMFHPSEMELSQTTNAMLAEVDRLHPSRIVFDSLSEMRLLAQSPLRYRRQILALKHFCAGRQATLLLLDDRTWEVTDHQLQSIAHGVIQLEQLAPEYGAERRRLRVIKLRGQAYTGGYHDFSIRRDGLEIYPRLVAAQHPKEFERGQLKSGLEALDTLVGGGLERGTSVLVVGPAGSGKSILALQYALAAVRRGERAALFGFEESTRTLLQRSAALGMDLSSFIESGHLSLQQIDPAELSPGEFAHAVRQAAEGGATVLVIDSLNGYLHARPEERFLTIQLHELLTYLGQQGVVTLLVVAQLGLFAGTSEVPIHTSYLSDAVIMLRYFEAEGRVRKAISVLKKRSGAHEDTIRELRIDSGGLSIGEPLVQFRGVLTGVPDYQGQPGPLLEPQ